MSAKEDRANTKEMTRALRLAGLTTGRSFKSGRDAINLVTEIPNDTRTLTGKVLGDPLPGRSALDRKSA